MSSITAFPSRGPRVEVIKQHAARGAAAIVPELTSLTREIRDIINSRTKVTNTIKARLRNVVFANAGIKKATKEQRSAASDEANEIYDAIVGLKPLTPKQEVYAAIVGPYAEAVRNFNRREHELEFEIVDRVGALGDLARWVEGVKGASPLGLGQILGCMGRLPHEFRSKRGMWKWMGLAVMHGGPHDGGGRAQGNVKNIPAGKAAGNAYKADKYSRSNRTTVAVMLNPLFNVPVGAHYRDIAISREAFELTKIPEVVKAKRRTRDRLSDQQRTIAALRAALADAAPVFAKDQKAAKIGKVASELTALVKRYRVNGSTHRTQTA